MKEFNTTGICNPEKHYMVDISSRIQKIKLDLVDKGKYFCINRARQYGKTTTISALKKFLSADYIVVGLDFQQLDNDVFATGASFAQALSRLFLDAAEFGKTSIPDNVVEAFSQINNREEKNVKMDEVFRIIRRWCSESNKPVVLIIDEVDSATNNQVFLDFLAQLREAYLSRESDGIPAFQSVILAGVTDVKHLKSKIRDDDSHKVNSPWNIAEDFTLDMSLSEAGIEKMLEEYSTDHNISINTTSIAKEIREYTSGYPFLVSRICKYIDKNLVGSSGRFDSAEKAWTTEGVSEAVRRVLNESNTLFESLMGKVQTDEELSRLLQTILFSGERISYNIYSSSISLASMYGFVRDDNGAVAISNRIFETVLYNYYLSREEMKNSSIYSIGNDDSDRRRLFMDKKAMYKLSYGLFVLTTKLGDKDNGCITNTAIQVTSEPNRIAFAVNKANLTHDMLMESKVFNISILSEEASFDVFKRFGFQSGREVDKFEDYELDQDYKVADNGITYILDGTNSYISGTVFARLDLGTHTLFICDVTDMDVLNDSPSATYDYYQSNIKPKPQDIAKGDVIGTVQKDENSTGKTIWRCTICGYEWEGEELPDDFICPWCKHPKADFEKIVR